MLFCTYLLLNVICTLDLSSRPSRAGLQELLSSLPGSFTPDSSFVSREILVSVSVLQGSGMCPVLTWTSGDFAFVNVTLVL